MVKPGYAYACCREADYSSIKIGFTEHECPDEYIHTSFSRTLHPLQTLKIMSCGNARLGESVIHHYLDVYRTAPQHELFNLASIGLKKLDDAFNTFRHLDDASGRPRPAENPVDRTEYRRQINTSLNKVSRDRNSVASKIRKEEREQKLAEVQLNRLKKKEESQKKLDIQKERRDKIFQDIKTFLDTKYVQKADGRIQTVTLYETFNQDRSDTEKVDINLISCIMQELGIEKKKARLKEGKNKSAQCFFGLTERED